MDIVWTPKFAAAGWLMDLSQRISKEQLAEFWLVMWMVDVMKEDYTGFLYALMPGCFITAKIY
jgi:hypothetical protein